MKILITGSAGHLGEALIRTIRQTDHEALGLDIQPSQFTDRVGSIADRDFVATCVADVDAIIHTATLHKPHVGTHSRQDFVDTNVTGTLNLLEEAVAHGNKAFVFTSTTSTFGDAMKPAPGDPAVWVTEELVPKPKNIYGVTKIAAENLCYLFHRNTQLPCLVLKTSRFFPEADDDKGQRDAFVDDNLKVNELLFRRADVADMVEAHLLAVQKAPDIGYGRMIVTATTPFAPEDAAELGVNAPAVLKRYVPDYETVFEPRGWRMFPSIGRVYDNSRARDVLGWQPRINFADAVARLGNNQSFKSDLALSIGAKGYHDVEFEDGPYPVRSF